MRVVVLAAGQGTRMSPLTDHTPKSLLPFGDSNILVRLVGQILDRFSGEVCLVVGHKKERVSNAVKDEYGDRIRIIENEHYLEDVNILSLSLAIEDEMSSFIVFESDCLLDNKAMDMIFSSNFKDVSSWYTIGTFLPGQVGGILLSDFNGDVMDIDIVPKFESRFKKYDKLLGILRVGPKEMGKFKQYISDEVKQSTKQYYLTPWIKNLSDLPCVATSLSDFNAGAFNTPDEYNKVLRMFKSNNYD